MRLHTLVSLSLALSLLLASNVTAEDPKDCEKNKAQEHDDVSGQSQGGATPVVVTPKAPHRSHKYHRYHHKHQHHKHHQYQNSTATDGASGGQQSGGMYGDSTINTEPDTPKKKKGGQASLSPGGRKAGVSGQQAAALLSSGISWVNNWGAKPYEAVPKGVEFVTQCYGFGMSGHPEDSSRFEDFKKVKPGQTPWVIGPNEADFKGAASAGLIEPKQAAKLWDQYIGPWKAAGSIVVSPSCAKQRDEVWMAPFLDAATVKPDIINVHLFDVDISNIKKVLDHYRAYKLPMWITEWACINFNTGHLCSQQETEAFIYAAVEIFENDAQVVAYSYADADNGPHCKLSQGDKLTASGHAYLNAISKFSGVGQKRMQKRQMDWLVTVKKFVKKGTNFVKKVL